MSYATEINNANFQLLNAFSNLCESIPSFDDTTSSVSDSELEIEKSNEDIVKLDKPDDEWDVELDKIEIIVQEQLTKLTQLTACIDKDVSTFQKGWFSFSQSKIWCVTAIAVVSAAVTSTANLVDLFFENNRTAHIVTFAIVAVSTLIGVVGTAWGIKIAYDSNTSLELKQIHTDGLDQARIFCEFIREFRKTRYKITKQRLTQEIFSRKIQNDDIENQMANNELLIANAQREELDTDIMGSFKRFKKLRNIYTKTTEGAFINVRSDNKDPLDLIVSQTIKELPQDDLLFIETHALSRFEPPAENIPLNDAPQGSPSVKILPANFEITTPSYSVIETHAQRGTKIGTPRFNFESLTGKSNKDVLDSEDLPLLPPAMVDRDDLTSSQAISSFVVEEAGRKLPIAEGVISGIQNIYNSLKDKINPRKSTGTLKEAQISDINDGRIYHQNFALLRLRLETRWGVTPKGIYAGEKYCSVYGVKPIRAQ